MGSCCSPLTTIESSTINMNDFSLDVVNGIYPNGFRMIDQDYPGEVKTYIIRQQGMQRMRELFHKFLFECREQGQKVSGYKYDGQPERHHSFQTGIVPIHPGKYFEYKEIGWDWKYLENLG